MPQRFDVGCCGVSVEEGAEAPISHGQRVVVVVPGDGMDCLAHPLLCGAAEGEGGLQNLDVPLVSK